MTQRWKAILASIITMGVVTVIGVLFIFQPLAEADIASAAWSPSIAISVYLVLSVLLLDWAAHRTRNSYSALTLLLFWLLATSTGVADETHRIAVIGTGDMGGALGQQLAGADHTIVYGSRDPSRDKVKQLVAETGVNVSATTQREAAERSEIIILAVPWSAVESLIPALGDLSGKIIIDITTGDRQATDGYPELAVETSTSELIQQWAPDARIVKTPFSGASTVRDPLRYGEPTVTYLAGDDKYAKEVVAKLAIQLGFFPLDAGPLRMARTIDHLGLLYLTPMMQGRDHTWTMIPRIDMDLSCVSTEGWFEPVMDRDDLARFANLEAVEKQCP